MRWLLTLALTALLLACSGSTEPERQAPATGTYDVTVQWRYPSDVEFFGPDEWRDFEATLTITSSSPTSLSGEWGGEDYKADFDFIGYNSGAYVVFGHPTHGGTVSHRIRVESSPDELSCTPSVAAGWGPEPPSTGECFIN